MRATILQHCWLFFVPCAVLNVSDWTTAITHNLVMGASLPSAFSREAGRDPAYAARWYRCLQSFDAEAAAALDAHAPAAVAAATAATTTEEEEEKARAEEEEEQEEGGGVGGSGSCKEHGELLESYRLVDSLVVDSQ